MLINEKELLKEIEFKTSRSGGKGGQHVNKVSTKVELIFNIPNSKNFNDEQKKILLEKLFEKIDSEGFLHVVSQASRSQLENKKIAISKFIKLIKKAFVIKKQRKSTKPPISAIDDRIKNKKMKGEQKKLRAKLKLD